MSANRKVAYLIGAGGTQGCVTAAGSNRGILTTHLAMDIAREMKALVSPGAEFESLNLIVNEVVTETADIEQLITFFDESPASLHRRFAEELRRVFESVLRSRLIDIRDELKSDRICLYSALLDMYNVDGIRESINGILTINYDDYIEDAVMTHFDQDKDQILGTGKVNGWNFLKLHGSIGWEDVWPIIRRRMDSDSIPLWIPPGIRKGKERFPFNLVWGLARDVLDCDVLRVIGCRLSSSDWDLISLLFGTRHANYRRKRPYTIEVIDNPAHAARLKEWYPYLDVKSVFEIETMDVGKHLVSDFLGGLSRSFDSLSAEDKGRLLNIDPNSDENWFRQWLHKMGEQLQDDLSVDATTTPSGEFRRWLGI